MNISPIKVYDDFDIFVYFCFMLNELGDLSEFVISEIVQTIESVNYFELISGISVMEKKKLIEIKRDDKRNESIYSLLPDGKVLAEEFVHRIPLTIREKTVETGNDILARLEREKSIRCSIIYDHNKKRYDLNVQFLNELNGQVILDLNIFAPDKEQAEDMKERFLSKPSYFVRRIMNIFLKDDYFMYD